MKYQQQYNQIVRKKKTKNAFQFSTRCYLKHWSQLLPEFYPALPHIQCRSPPKVGRKWMTVWKKLSGTCSLPQVAGDKHKIMNGPLLSAITWAGLLGLWIRHHLHKGTPFLMRKFQTLKQSHIFNLSLHAKRGSNHNMKKVICYLQPPTGGWRQT